MIGPGGAQLKSGGKLSFGSQKIVFLGMQVVEIGATRPGSDTKVLVCGCLVRLGFPCRCVKYCGWTYWTPEQTAASSGCAKLMESSNAKMIATSQKLHVQCRAMLGLALSMALPDECPFETR